MDGYRNLLPEEAMRRLTVCTRCGNLVHLDYIAEHERAIHAATR